MENILVKVHFDEYKNQTCVFFLCPHRSDALVQLVNMDTVHTKLTLHSLCFKRRVPLQTESHIYHAAKEEADNVRNPSVRNVSR